MYACTGSRYMQDHLVETYKNILAFTVRYDSINITHVTSYKMICDHTVRTHHSGPLYDTARR